jgi:hypothetical protein
MRTATSEFQEAYLRQTLSVVGLLGFCNRACSAPSGGGVIWNGVPSQKPVIPAKAGIYAAKPQGCFVYGAGASLGRPICRGTACRPLFACRPLTRVGQALPLQLPRDGLPLSRESGVSTCSSLQTSVARRGPPGGVEGPHAVLCVDHCSNVIYELLARPRVSRWLGRYTSN